MSNSADDFINMFRNVTGMDNVVYRCVKCGNVVERITVKTADEGFRKLFYCKNNKCLRFGVITVVAKK